MKVYEDDPNNRHQPDYKKWSEMWKLLHSEDLGTILRVRLLQIALDNVGSGSACIRAIELLMGVGGEVVQDELAGVDVEVLLEAREKANVWVSQLTRRIETAGSQPRNGADTPGENTEDSGKPPPDRLL